MKKTQNQKCDRNAVNVAKNSDNCITIESRTTRNKSKREYI